MDPNEALRNFHSAVAAARSAKTEEHKVREMANAIDAIDALDDWLSLGGLLPEEWQNRCKIEHQHHGLCPGEGRR